MRMHPVFAFIVIIFTSTIIYVSGKRFSVSSSKLGDHLKLSRSVKGATFDAIAGSIPELFVALFAVIAFKKFEVGVGTIIGSALFNLLVIPALCVMVAPKMFKISKEVVNRDGIFYAITTFTLLIAVFYFKVWNFFMPLIFFGMYLWYIKSLKDTNNQKKPEEKVVTLAQEVDKEIRIVLTITQFFLHMFIMGVATYFLTEAAISFAETLGIPTLVIGFTILAAATSVPDTIISAVNAHRGHLDDAASNVFGSNIFDILIGLSIPAAVAILYSGPIAITFEYAELVLGLLGVSLLVLFVLARNYILTKKNAAFFLLLYFTFVGYVVYLAL